jgi:ferredoxin
VDPRPRPSIDPELCVTAGQCARAVPQVFAIGEEDGVGTVIDPDPPEELWRDVRYAAHTCPGQAISVD